MDQEAIVIRQQMEDTKSSIQEKVGQLEQQVKEAAIAVTDTVQTVKATVEGTVESVKDTVAGTVESVRDSLNLSRHVEERPWTMLLGSIAVGFVGAHLVQGKKPHMRQAPTSPLKDGGWAKNGRFSMDHIEKLPEPEANGLLDPLLKAYGDELEKLKGLATAAAVGVVRDILVQSAPSGLGIQIAEVLDGITVKLGGKPIQGPILKPAEGEKTSHESGALSKRYQPTACSRP